MSAPTSHTREALSCSRTSHPLPHQPATHRSTPFALLGLAHGLDNAHGPNEHFDLGRIRKGALILARTLENLRDLHNS